MVGFAVAWKRDVKDQKYLNILSPALDFFLPAVFIAIVAVITQPLALRLTGLLVVIWVG